MDTIAYEDFAKLDVRIGEILSVELIDGADKLLKCMVDVGDVDSDGKKVPRQILSGIREYLEDPQILVGRKFPYVVNLAPRTIRGHVSNGMILASVHEGKLALLSPTADIPAGTKVS